MVSFRSVLFLGWALVFVSLVDVVAPAPVSAQCPTLPAPVALPGNTEFNNTTRAQMWINENTWWGAFSDASSGIYFYKRVGNSYEKRNLIDGNFAAGKPDTVWNGVDLFVLVYQSGSLAKLYKYNYFPAVDMPFHKFPEAYFLVWGFPIDLPLAGLANAIALHQDSRGKLWATYTSGRNVHVIWSTSADHMTWNTRGIILASNVADFTTEAAAIVPFGGDKIGVVWGNQAVGEIAFRFHRDGDPDTSWSPKEIVDCCEGFPDPEDPGQLTQIVSDDHLALRAAPDGRLFLIAKDDIGAGRLHLYIRGVDGRWGQKTIVNPSPVAEPTRPTLALDTGNNHAYVIYRETVDNRIYFSRTSMNSPAFDQPCIFIDTPPLDALGRVRVTNPTSTKQNVNGTTDLVGVASTNRDQLLSNVINLAP